MTTTQCAHHWIIEKADGPRSTGRCNLCGEEREFSNSAQFMATYWKPQAKWSPVDTQPAEAEDE